MELVKQKSSGKFVQSSRTQEKSTTASNTFWGAQWMFGIERVVPRSILAKARSYDPNQIVAVEFKKDKIQAQVCGVRNEVCNITLSLAHLSKLDWETVLRIMWQESNMLGLAYAGELPEMVIRTLYARGVAVFPYYKDDLKIAYSCKDLKTPCKHIAALCCFLADWFNKDHFLIFALRGYSRNEIIQKLRMQSTENSYGIVEGRVNKAKEQTASSLLQEKIPLTTDIESFWEGSNDNPIEVNNPQNYCPERMIAQKLSHLPFSSNVITALHEVYQEASVQAQKRGQALLHAMVLNP